jgi:hypothetical protein
VNKIRATGLSIDEKQKHKCQVLSEKLDIEHTPRKSLKHLPHGTGVPKFSARKATQLLKFRHYKITVIHTFQLAIQLAGSLL